MNNKTESIKNELDEIIKTISLINKCSINTVASGMLKFFKESFKDDLNLYYYIFKENVGDEEIFYKLWARCVDSIPQEPCKQFNSLEKREKDEVINICINLLKHYNRKNYELAVNKNIEKILEFSKSKYWSGNGKDMLKYSIDKYNLNIFDERLKSFHIDKSLIIYAFKELISKRKHDSEDIKRFINSIPKDIKNREIFVSNIYNLYFLHYYSNFTYYSMFHGEFKDDFFTAMSVINFISREEFSNKKVILKLIRHYPHFISECNKKLKTDKSFILKAMEENNNIFPYLSKELRYDKDIAMMAIPIDRFLSYTTLELLKEKDFVKKYIYAHPSSVDFIVSSGKLTFDIYNDEMIYPLLANGNISFESISKRLQNDKKYILAALRVQYLSISLFNNLPLKFRKDRKIALEAIKKHETCYSYLCDSLKNNERFLLRALKENNDLARVIVKENPQIFLNSKLLALYIVKKYNNAISFLSEDLRNDKEIIINAVIGAQSSNYFNLIPEHFWNDKTVVLKAIENEENYLKFASPQIQALCQGKDPIATLTKAIEVEKLHKEIQDELPPTEQQIEPTRKKLKKI